jgi:ribosomal protein L37E
VSDRLEQEQSTKVVAAPLRTCNRCGSVLTEVYTLLDSRKGRSLRITRCKKCGEQTWSEDQ